MTNASSQSSNHSDHGARRRLPRLGGALLLVGLASALSQVSQAAAPAGRYTVTTSTVLDNKTGLVWQRVVDTNRYLTAEEIGPYCAGVSLPGSGWRAPSVKELATLVDDSRTFPAWDTTVFADTEFYYFGTSTQTGGAYWYVFFAAGTHGTDRFSSLARCVR